MFASSTLPPAGLTNTGRRMLRRACRFDPELHLQLMRRATAWTQECHLSGFDAYTAEGPHGDLWFLLTSLRSSLEACRFVAVHRLWLSPAEHSQHLQKRR